MAIKYHFFLDGIFSNWHSCKFTIDSIEYNCVEQYMMYQKAILFNDFEIAKRILESSAPRQQKALGKIVINYNDEIWSKNRYNIVKKGIKEKFIQNKKLLNQLANYKNYTFVECSPVDRIWGIGFFEEDAIKNIDNWGLNLLGKILTETTKELHGN